MMLFYIYLFILPMKDNLVFQSVFHHLLFEKSYYAPYCYCRLNIRIWKWCNMCWC